MGSYLVNVTIPTSRDGQTVPASVQAAVSVPYPKEFRTVRDNAALARKVAERTGGRVLQLAQDPKLLSAFDRTGLEVPASAKRIWDLMLILAAAIFVVDVAVRRLAFEPGTARDLAEKALGRTEQVGEATVAAWKKARSKAEGKGPRDAAGAGSGTGGGSGAGTGAGTGAERAARGEARSAAAGARFDEAGSPSMDVAGEAKGEDGARKGPSGETGGQPPPAKPEDDAHTSRLLKAKRRAKGPDGGAGSGGSEPGGSDGEEQRG
jgi:hypothetical protein